MSIGPVYKLFMNGHNGMTNRYQPQARLTSTTGKTNQTLIVNLIMIVNIKYEKDTGTKVEINRTINHYLLMNEQTNEKILSLSVVT